MLGQKRDRDDEYGNDELSKMSEGDKKDEELGIGDVPPSKKKERWKKF